jgi:hypothetical protein
MVDVVGDRWIEVTDRVIAYAGEMANSIETDQIVVVDIPHIFPDGWDVFAVLAKGAPLE